MQIKIYDSKVAKLYIATQNKAIVAISFSALDEDYLNKLIERPFVNLSGKRNTNIEMWLDTFFKGKDPNFFVNIELHGTTFQKSVWLACAKIPYGETRYYSDIANMIGNPKAVRAVGTALSQNPIPLIIPCHRVFRSNGDMGGFAGGLNLKRSLLNLERKNLEE